MKAQPLSRMQAYATTTQISGGRGEIVIDIEGMLIDVIILVKTMKVPAKEFLGKCAELYEAVDIERINFDAPNAPSTNTKH